MADAAKRKGFVTTEDFSQVIEVPIELFEVLKTVRDLRLSTKVEMSAFEGNIGSIVLPKLDAQKFLRLAKAAAKGKTIAEVSA